MEKKWKKEGWWTSLYNWDSDLRSTFALPKNIEIHDATLRDGEQTPGVILSIEDKVNIAKMLNDLGVERIEAGMPAVSKDDEEAIKRIVDLGLKSKIFAFARATKEDIDLALSCGVDGVIIEIPTSTPKLKYQFPKWQKADIIANSVDTVKYAKEKGLETVYFGYDTTRADFDFLIELYENVITKGNPDSIGIVDTMGCILPSAMFNLIKKLKNMFDVKFEVHTHNDYGMSVAISLAAIEAGAEVIHTSINGMGERAGNTPIEPIMIALKTLYGYENKYQLDLLKKISDKVEEISGFKKAVNQPIVGNNVFVRESGIGIDMVLNNPLVMYATVPELSGNKAGVVVGKKSGLRTIDVMIEKLGLSEIDHEMKVALLENIKSESIRLRRLISDQEFIDLYKDIKNEEKK